MANQPQTQITTSQTQPHIQAPAQPQDNSTATATATTGKANVSPPQNHPCSTTLETLSRPRKIRKMSPEGHHSKIETPKTTTKNTKYKIQPKPIPKIIFRPLSSPGEIEIALRHLRNSDPQLSPLLDLFNPPSFDSFDPPFLALTKSIIYQQLSYKAGTSIYNRFLSLCGGQHSVVPHKLLSLNPKELRQVGVSARKASYLQDLAKKYQNGILSDSKIVEMDDKSLFTMLTMVNGIGAWSVHMFMIFSLHRPDVIPVHDVGFRKGVQILYGLEELPRPSQMEQLCEKWRPYRSVGSWYMWRLVESKGTPSTLQQQHQQQIEQQQHQQHQFLDPIINLGYTRLKVLLLPLDLGPAGGDSDWKPKTLEFITYIRQPIQQGGL